MQLDQRDWPAALRDAPIQLAQRRRRINPVNLVPTLGAVLLGVTVIALVGCSGSPPAEVIDVAAVKADLQVVAGARVVLGHQSVGRNILDGVREWSAELGVPLRIVEISGSPPDDLPGLFHSYIGTNGDPASKCEAFVTLLGQPLQRPYDLAMMKFCYVDMERRDRHDAEQLLDQYVAMLARLRAAHPDLRMLEVTMPLRADPPGVRAWIKRLIGRPTEEDDDNAARNAYNEALRRRFAGDSLFDLATAESTRADGSRSAFMRNGAVVYTLAQNYTTDGGHLNREGRRHIAAVFLHAIATPLRAAR